MRRRLIFALLTTILVVAQPLSLLAGEALWIDVRTADEFSAGHVTQAVNIPYDVIAEGIGSVSEDKDALIYVYCRSGRRSGIAKETLEGLGYTEVVNVGGLNDALKKAGQAHE